MTRTASFDAVVIGAGINGMVAAAELALAGWTVALIERNREIGGFIATEERTRPGYLHDTYSSWHSQFVSGGAYAVLGEELRECGLEYVNSDSEVCASVTGDGEVTLAYRSPRKTAATFEHAEDARTYRRHVKRVMDNGQGIGTVMSNEFRSLATTQAMLTMLRATGVSGSESWLRDLATSGRSWCRREFLGPEVDRLFVPWLLHAGLSPDHASGGFVIPVFAANLHSAGVPVAVGGSARLVQAFRSLLESLDVRIITGVAADRIALEDGRAVGVIINNDLIGADSAVLASVTPTALYGKLLPPDAVSQDIRYGAQRFRYGRAAMQVHVALDAPLDWKDARLNATPIIHLSDGSSTTAIACAEAEAGLLPSRPTVVVGQQHILDSSRVPEGAGALWIQLHEVPYKPLGDARDELDVSHGWTPELGHKYADRVLDRLAPHVRGLHESVLHVDVITPKALNAYNSNALYGDPYGGDSQLDQNFLWRPFPQASSHRTAIADLWHIGASTHPGAGLGGASGHLVAQKLLATPGNAGRARAAVGRMMRRTALGRR
ncbi:phytoene desaturase family protein [Actinoplanes solisilvae]|uniref:phytoene desaturase family protein n=1 Tax=Actinoplanes solisilvae TaxID=2486853 RepID=UPI000FD900D2|nr:NAD(P)/FAD-dependent oxidoreductase [Actinoplanes solisilvae]